MTPHVRDPLPALVPRASSPERRERTATGDLSIRRGPGEGSWSDCTKRNATHSMRRDLSNVYCRPSRAGGSPSISQQGSPRNSQAALNRSAALGKA